MLSNFVMIYLPRLRNPEGPQQLLRMVHVHNTQTMIAGRLHFVTFIFMCLFYKQTLEQESILQCSID